MCAGPFGLTRETTLPNTIPTKVAATLVASISNAAASTTRGTLDIRGKVGVFITMKIANGATGPTAQCVCNILVSHATGATPTAASAGANWKTYWSFGGGTVENAVTEQTTWIEGVQHVAIEYTGNTAQAVTVEALATVTNAYETA
jgi:hypothetical protein